MDYPFCNISKEKIRILIRKWKSFGNIQQSKINARTFISRAKKHIEKISELDEGEQKELFKTTIEFQELILKNISKGCGIRQNYRPFQKQDSLKVNHFHIHLQPRELFDELYEKCQIFEKQIFKDLNKEKLEKYFKLLSD